MVKYHHGTLFPWFIWVKFNAAVGPLVMATCTLLSATWFPSKERGTATYCCIIQQLGLIYWLLWSICTNDMDNLPKLLWIHFGVVMVALVLVVLYFLLPTPPSSSSDSREKQLASNDNSTYLFLQDTKKALQIPEFMWLAIVGGAVGGIYNVWSGSLDTIIPNTILTTKQCALLGRFSRLLFRWNCSCLRRIK